MDKPDVRVLTYVRASNEDEARGLLGFLRVGYGSLVLDGIALRRTRDGRFALSFPARTDRGGQQHPYVRPADAGAREAIEREVLAQLAAEDPTAVPGAKSHRLPTVD